MQDIPLSELEAFREGLFAFAEEEAAELCRRVDRTGQLPPEDRELVLLRCVNEVPMAVLSQLYGQSRFALRRRLNGILGRLRDALE